MALGLESKADRILAASDALIPSGPDVPNFASPVVSKGGVYGALASSSSKETAPIVQNVYPTPGMSEKTVAELTARKLLLRFVG